MKTFIKNLLSDSSEVSSMRFSLVWILVLLTALVTVYIIISLESYNWKLDIAILDKLNVLILGLSGVSVVKLLQKVFGEQKEIKDCKENKIEEK